MVYDYLWIVIQRRFFGFCYFCLCHRVFHHHYNYYLVGWDLAADMHASHDDEYDTYTYIGTYTIHRYYLYLWTVCNDIHLTRSLSHIQRSQRALKWYFMLDKFANAQKPKEYSQKDIWHEIKNHQTNKKKRRIHRIFHVYFLYNNFSAGFLWTLAMVARVEYVLQC